MSDEERVDVQLGDGRFGTVPKSQLATVQSRGGRIAGSQEVAAARAKRESSTLQGQAKEHLEGQGAAGVAMARGASMGASDELALGLSDLFGKKEVVRGKLNEMREKHPYASGAGEVVGNILPGIESGGATVAAKAPVAIREATTLAREAPALASVMRDGSGAVKTADAVASHGQTVQAGVEQGSRIAKRLGAEDYVEQITGRRPGGPLSPEEAASHQQKIDQWVEGHLREAKRLDQAKEARALNPAASSPERAAAADEATNVGGRRAPAATPEDAAAQEVERVDDAHYDERQRPDWWKGIDAKGDPQQELADQFALGKGPRDEATTPGLGGKPTEEVPTRVDPLKPPYQAHPENDTTAPGIGPREGVDPFGRTEAGAPPQVHQGEVIDPTLPGTPPPFTAPRVQAPAERVIDVIGQEVLGQTPEAVHGAPALSEVMQPRSGIANALPAHLLGIVGDEVERGVSKLMGGEAKSLLGKMAQHGVSTAARGAAEGALLGAAQELDEEALGNEKLNGEKLLAAMGHGALWGGVSGGVLGSGSVLTRRVAGDLAAGVAKMRGEYAFRALGGIKRDLSRASNIPGGARAVGEYLVDNGFIRSGEKLEDFAPRIMSGVEAKGQEIGVLLDAHDRAGLRGPVVNRIIADMESGMLGKMRELSSLNAGAIAKVEALQTDLLSAAHRAPGEQSMSFRDAQRIRSRLDDAVRWTRPAPGAPVSEVNEALKGARRAMEREIEGAIDRSGSKLGPEYKAIKDEYRKLRVAADTVGDALERKAANNIIRPTDYLASMAGMLTGHPLLGLASGIAHHIVKDRGNSTAAVALAHLGGIGIVRAARDKMDRQIVRGVSRVLGDKAAAVGTKELHLGGDHEARVEALARSIMDGSHSDAVFAAVGPISGSAPKTADAFTKSALRVTQYLASKMPQSMPRPDMLTPHLDVQEWSDSDKSTFARAVDMAHDPISILPELERGTVTPDQVDALKTMYPDLYANMCDELANQLAARDKPLPYNQRLALGVFLNRPVDPTLEAQFIATMQQNFPTEHGLPGAGAPKKKGGHGKPKAGSFDHMIESMALEGSLDQADDAL